MSADLIRQEFGGLDLLIVEDDEFLQSLLVGILEATELCIHVANNGQEAVEQAKEISFKMIYMDMQMPVMSGIEATRHIRQLPAYADVPIVALTGNVVKADHLECLKVGMDEVIIKPVKMQQLYENTLKWLRSGR